MKILFVFPSPQKYPLVHQKCTALQMIMHKHHQVGIDILDGDLFIQNSQESIQACNDADIIIIHAAVLPFGQKAIQHWKARDKTLIADLSVPIIYDSEKHKYQIGLELTTTLPAEKTQPVEVDDNEFIWSLKLVESGYSNSKLIVEDWKGILEMKYLPDMLELDKYLIHPYESHTGLILGINIASGGINKLTETGLRPALEKVLHQNQGIRVIVFGDHPHQAYQIKANGERKFFLPGIEKDQWQSVLPSIDIGLLPRSGEVDDRLGREAVLEFMAMKIPWAGSESISLFDQRSYGWLVPNHQTSWQKVLEDLIEHVDNYRKDTNDSYLFALGQGLEENFDRLISTCIQFHTKIWDGVK